MILPNVSNPLNLKAGELEDLIVSLRKTDPKHRYDDNQLFLMYVEGARLQANGVAFGVDGESISSYKERNGF